MAWMGEGVPGDVEPAGAGQELVGQGVLAQDVYQALELPGVFGADVVDCRVHNCWCLLFTTAKIVQTAG